MTFMFMIYVTDIGQIYAIYIWYIYMNENSPHVSISYDLGTVLTRGGGFKVPAA